jgi:hypothetical protein
MKLRDLDIENRSFIKLRDLDIENELSNNKKLRTHFNIVFIFHKRLK